MGVLIHKALHPVAEVGVGVEAGISWPSSRRLINGLPEMHGTFPVRAESVKCYPVGISDLVLTQYTYRYIYSMYEYLHFRVGSENSS